MNYRLVNKINFFNQSKLFLFGLILKIFIILTLEPLISNKLFLPFIDNFINNLTIDPWSNFLENSGDINAFPYGITMLIGYLPLSFLGRFLDQNFYDFNLFELGFKFTSLFYDYLLLIFLSFLTKNKSSKILIIAYWLSPIVIYTTYIHGQIDILPISLLIISLLFIKKEKFIFSGILFALSVITKFSMLIAFPFICIYLIKRRGLGKHFIRFVISFFVIIFILFAPYFYSFGFMKMVLGTRELDRIYNVYLSYGNNLKLYIIPVSYLISLFLILRIKRITQDLFILSMGLGFFAIIVFLPPATAWPIWIVPFLVFYQINSKKDFLLITFIYSFVIVLNTIFLSNDIIYGLTENFLNLKPINNLANNYRFTNITFTIQQSLGFLLAIRIYIYGLKRNNFYSVNQNPILISIKGNKFDITRNFRLSIENIFNKRDLKIIDLEHISDENKYDSDYSGKIPYYANYISKTIDKINQEINNNTKDFIALFNPKNIKLESLSRKVDIDINIIDEKNKNLSLPSKAQIYSNALFFIFHQNSINSLEKKILITYFPIGYLHKKLFNLFISISSLNVDIELVDDQSLVKMTIEGEPSKEDIYQIANSLIEEIDDFLLNEKYWYSGYIGIMQLIFIAKLSKTLQKR